MSLLLAIQSFAQLQKLYGRDTTSIILSNAATHLVLRGIGDEEAAFYSRRIGDTTIRTRSQGIAGVATSQEVARPLIRPEELRTMPESQMLVLADHAHPVRVRATPYYRDKQLAARAKRPLPGFEPLIAGAALDGEESLAPAEPDTVTVPSPFSGGDTYA